MSDLPLSQKFARLNPFKPGEDDEDQGGAIAVDSVGGGGRGTRKAHLDKQQLRVSSALRSFMAKNDILSEADAGVDSEEPTPALRSLLGRSHFHVPPALLDRSRPLPEYYISSSHNTYLMAHQLYGTSCASAYETALRTGSRCVEIDAWDNSADMDEPKVTHGYTLVSHVPFRDVCRTIRDVFDHEVAVAARDHSFEVAPILLSLENHCGDHGQRRLVAIMKEVFEHRLLSEPIREKGHREQTQHEEGNHDDDMHVTLADLGACVSVIVEYHLGDPIDEPDSPASPDDEEGDYYNDGYADRGRGDEAAAAAAAAARRAEEKKALQEYQQRTQDCPRGIIVPELAQLGVYAQSVKPIDTSWFAPPGSTLANGPHHHLINVSESGLAKHLPAQAAPIAVHNAKHLMRVFPKGTRISSSNLKPLAFWAVGAQICALNWQTFGTSNQLNDALFSGSEGYILKPAALRHGGDGDLLRGGADARRCRLRLRVAGATDIPVDHAEREPDSLRPYLTCNLYSPGHVDGDTNKRKTSPYRHHRLGFLHHGDNPPVTDPVWDETLEWEYQDNELVFLRMLIKSDDAWAKNPMIAVAAIRLLYVVPGWSFVRMMDMKGRETKCSILVHFQIDHL
ncbi:1-phosphatidylinositol-4,5-bisphosphate phosphodiesterase gamma 2 [Moelleriella libera RCEF 2490]|uniref:Phosphoinositide phospholipase C n=1 Tax=Moelleriella libera RCEF 2490 TaxID=1081109 RepID=A0A166P3Z1_9HYPO|nr:1-phosphatidylinositol-4,5-bisphosphate phosphodiesterase gamma 2 [Moelleriella libera RCEF 2490]